jgi:hypothetical protein
VLPGWTVERVLANIENPEKPRKVILRKKPPILPVKFEEGYDPVIEGEERWEREREKQGMYGDKRWDDKL